MAVNRENPSHLKLNCHRSVYAASLWIEPENSTEASVPIGVVLTVISHVIWVPLLRGDSKEPPLSRVALEARQEARRGAENRSSEEGVWRI